MTLSRRNFVRAAGVGGIGALATPLIAARGNEALRGAWLEPELANGILGGSFEHEERAPFRIASPDAIQLDSNENPNGPGKLALDAVAKMFTEANRYPDVQADDLQKAVAAARKVAPQNVLLGCGSGEILRVAVQAFTSPTKALVTAAPSFEDPARQAELIGSPVRAVPVDANLKLDLDRMLDQINGAGLVFFCNPNNPTSTVHGASQVKEFIAQVNKRAPDCVVLMDEAYHEYVDEPTYATSIPISLENPKVITVRTFSKVFGMAGLRAGYAIGRPETLRPMGRLLLGSNINVLAAAAGVATLPDQARIDREHQLNKDAREFTRKSFETMGYKPIVSNANFIMVNINRDTRQFKNECAKHGILVGRPFPPLTTHLRVSIGTMDEMKKAVDVFKQVLSGAAN
jgi:histidinol-phosphate aminotransferase